MISINYNFWYKRCRPSYIYSRMIGFVQILMVMQQFEFGLIDKANRVVIRVEDYQPFCRIELPSFVSGCYVQWTEDALKVYVAWLRKIMGDNKPTRIVYSELERLYMYKQRIKSPFLTCYFRSEDALRHCTNVINKQPYNIDQFGNIKARVWETNIQTVHRLVTELRVGYGQWLSLTAEKVIELDRITSGDTQEYIASWKNISGMKDEDVSGWITREFH